MDLYEWRKGGLLFEKWVKHPIFDKRFSMILKADPLLEVETWVTGAGNQRKQTYTSRTEGGLAEGATFKNYHYHPLKPFSEEALLAGFFMIWLKKYLVPTHLYKVLLPTMELPMVPLVVHHRVVLLPDMMANLQYGLYWLVVECMKGVENPCMELPYTYLMAWFLLHCPLLMEPPKTAIVPLVWW